MFRLSERKVATGGGTVCAICLMNSSDIGPGPLAYWLQDQLRKHHIQQPFLLHIPLFYTTDFNSGYHYFYFT